MGKEIELLKDHSHSGPHGTHVYLTSNQTAFKFNLAAIGFFQMIEATQEGALARSAWADYSDDLALSDRHIDAAEHFDFPEALS